VDPRVVLALVLAAVGCEYRPLTLPGPDAGLAPMPSQPVGGSSGSGGGAGDCDPVAQNCGGGQRCAPDCKTMRWACAPRGSNAHLGQGAVCGLDEDCLPGFACLEDAGRAGAGFRCARYCRDNGGCEGGTRCMAIPVRCRDSGATIDRHVCVTR
jgi:hypothetical protein